jgi:hypothetical protein
VPAMRRAQSGVDQVLRARFSAISAPEVQAAMVRRLCVLGAGGRGQRKLLWQPLRRVAGAPLGLEPAPSPVSRATPVCGRTGQACVGDGQLLCSLRGLVGIACRTCPSWLAGFIRAARLA